MVATLLERFNSGKVSAMMSLYAPEAVFIAKDGRTITDHTEIAAELERQAIAQALQATGGNKLATARLLGISRAKLYACLA